MSYGVNLTLTCNTEGSDGLLYYWERSPPLVGSDTLERGLNSSELVISNVGPEDEGVYTCSVSFGGDSIGSRSISINTTGQCRFSLLEIQRKSYLSLSPSTSGPTFIETLLPSYTVTMGEDLELRVVVQNSEGSPDIQFQWYRNGNGISESNASFTLDSMGYSNGTWVGQLTINNVERSDTGNGYAVTAYNIFIRDGVTSSTTITVRCKLVCQ